MTHFDQDSFERAIEVLTDPSHGHVYPTGYENIFALSDELPEPTDGILAITGPSGAGKDSLISKLLIHDERLVQVRTATTRVQRPGEDDDAYTWMDQNVDGLPTEEYHAWLIEKYGLLEFDFHHGNLYGLPQANVEALADDEQIGVINTDISGIASIKDLLPATGLVSVLVCPESSDSLIRNMGDSRDNITERLAVAHTYLQRAPEMVDYVFHNRHTDDIESTLSSIAQTIVNLALVEQEV